MSTEQAKIDAYMAQFDVALRRYALKEQADIARDLRSHIREAIDYGKPVEDVLHALGAPDTLARAYAVELLVDGASVSRPNGVLRALKLAGIVAAGGIVTYVVVVGLGAISITFLLSGVLLFVVGGLEAAGIHLPHVQTNNLPPILFMALGPAFFAIGWGAGALLMRYIRFLARAIRAALPAKPKRAS